MAEQQPDRGDAAEFLRCAPFDVHLGILRRLSPKWILRMRAVCTTWRGVVSNPALLFVLQRVVPQRQLISFDRAACPDSYIRLRDYCAESLDLRSGELRPVIRFSDNEYYGFVDNAGGRRATPIHASRVDYQKMEQDYADFFFKPHLFVYGSLDGYLLVSFLNGWYVINPATRSWVALPDLTTYLVAGFYKHGSSGDYRVLCLSKTNVEEASTPNSTWYYYILTVGTMEMRMIGFGLGLDYACISQPIQLLTNMHLHWPPHMCQEYHLLAFDTEAEEFRWMRHPPVTVTNTDIMRLLELPPSRLGLSVSKMNRETLELWCLEDYQKENWVRVYRIRLALQQMSVLRQEEHWFPSVVSQEGDVLIQSTHWLLHCDRNGNLLRKFWFPEVPMARHMLRESLFRHPMFRAAINDDASPPPFFHWLCSDPSW